MNLSRNRPIALFFLSLSLCSIPVNANTLLDVAQDQINKISPKPVVHKMPLEFKQAVARYIKYTDNHCLQSSQRHTDENVSYKKELRYLFKNYGNFSTAALLLRLRSAHQAMVKHELDSGSDVYKRYEQISSALLLVCAQVFFNDARNQILGALQEVDSLIAYWRYQHGHQLSYFFSKSPIKWIAGKSQDKEITQNLSRLERKQRELYTLLGSLTGHVHAFTESGITYNDCYVWIEQLFVVLSSVKGLTHYNVDGTQFDRIAAELEAKIKRVDGLKDSYLTSIASTKKSNHFVRNWIPYTAFVAGTAYALHHHAHNPETFPAAIAGAQDSAKYLLLVLVDPLNKIYKRVQTALSPKVDNALETALSPKVDNALETSLSSKVDNDSKNQFNEDLEGRQLSDFEGPLPTSSVDDLCEQLRIVAKEMVSDINEELAKSNTSVREDAFIILDEAIKEAKSPTDGILYSSSPYIFDEESVSDVARQIILTKVEPIKKDGVVINQEEVIKYQATLNGVYKTIDQLWEQAPKNATGFALKGKLQIVKFLLRLDNDYLGPLRKYTDIIDLKVLKEAELIADLADNLGRRGDFLLNKAEYEIEDAKIIMHDLVNKVEYEIEDAKIIMHDLVNKIEGEIEEADVIMNDLVRDIRIQLAEADATLQDNQLTFMFTSLIPLMLTCAGVTKTYQWATKKNYAPIRVALADINSLLIESAMQLDDHDYGKLVYLICKLRTKSKILKSALSADFLSDVAKLESKRYAAQTKRDIVENMFNKYAFLGRIAV